jgi:hypothetical protein
MTPCAGHFDNRDYLWPARGPAADGGVRPTLFAGASLWENYAALGALVAHKNSNYKAPLKTKWHWANARSTRSFRSEQALVGGFHEHVRGPGSSGRTV